MLTQKAKRIYDDEGNAHIFVCHMDESGLAQGPYILLDAYYNLTQEGFFKDNQNHGLITDYCNTGFIESQYMYEKGECVKEISVPSPVFKALSRDSNDLLDEFKAKKLHFLRLNKKNDPARDDINQQICYARQIKANKLAKVIAYEFHQKSHPVENKKRMTALKFNDILSNPKFLYLRKAHQIKLSKKQDVVRKQVCKNILLARRIEAKKLALVFAYEFHHDTKYIGHHNRLTALKFKDIKENANFLYLRD